MEDGVRGHQRSCTSSALFRWARARAMGERLSLTTSGPSGKVTTTVAKAVTATAIAGTDRGTQPVGALNAYSHLPDVAL